MSNRNTAFGGTDWADGDVLTHTDLNDTLSVTMTYYTNAVNYSLPPVGSILPYHISWAGSNGTIPAGWKDCDGSQINDVDSPMNNQFVPALNGNSDSTKLFLKGNTTSGGTGGSTTHTHTYSLSDYMNPTTNTYRAKMTFKTASTIPPYFEIRWIMRIK